MIKPNYSTLLSRPICGEYFQYKPYFISDKLYKTFLHNNVSFYIYPFKKKKAHKQIVWRKKRY